MTSQKKSPLKEQVNQGSNVVHALASSVSFEEAGDLDLTDMFVERLNQGASINQLESEITFALEYLEEKLKQLKIKSSEQLEDALRITLLEDEYENQHSLGEPKF